MSAAQVPIRLTLTIGGGPCSTNDGAPCSPRCGGRTCMAVSVHVADDNRTFSGVMPQNMTIGDWIAGVVETFQFDYTRDANGVWFRPLRLDDLI